MAIDSEQKRKSVPSVMRFGRPRAIIPSGTIAQADRQQIGWGWAGIDAGGAAGPTFPRKLISPLLIRNPNDVLG